ncbi:MAG: RNA 2',3'-cyclic phosphodiesterase [Candidatus Omnitrophota bacterium]
MPSDSIRTFIALEINEEIKEKIENVQSTIKLTNSIKGSWVKKENLHLTLKFLGDTQIKHIEEIKGKIKESFKDESSINCSLSGVGIFPNARSPRVIWVGIKNGAVEIINLASNLETTLSQLGFKKEKRDFKTHITICRPKQILGQQKLQNALEEINKQFSPQEFVINKITFLESKLTSQGSIYTPILSYQLK